MTFMQRSSFSRISVKYAINFSISSYSARNLSCSRPVSWRRRISTMARAWRSESENRSIKLSIASFGLLDALMMAMTSSMLSDAMSKPSRMCARSFAFSRSNFVRRITTSCRWSTNAWIKSFRFKRRGRPLTSAMLFTLNDDCRAVSLYNLFNTTLELASRFTSTTMRIPPRLEDSSLTLEMPSIRFSFTKSAILLIKSDLMTWYGISVMMIFSWLASCSISAFPRKMIRPRPVSKASLTPA